MNNAGLGPHRTGGLYRRNQDNALHYLNSTKETNVEKPSSRSSAKLPNCSPHQKLVRYVLVKAYGVMQAALPVCELVAAATPSRTDGEVLALTRK